MRDHSIWSMSLGRWGGVHVQVHMFFLLFVVFTLYLGVVSDEPGMVGIGALSLLILFVSVLLHELAHCHTAFQSGVSVEQIVIGPLGGLAPLRLRHRPRRELVVILAGPLANLVICLSCVPLLMFATEGKVFGLLHPLHPTDLLGGGSLARVLKLTFWINWMLLLANLLPVYPLDGGRALRAGLSLLWPNLGRRNAVMGVAALAKLVFVGLLIAAWLVRDAEPKQPVPVWFALVLLAIFVFFGAKQESDRQIVEDEDEALFGYDFSQGYTSLEESVEQPHRPHPGPVARWMEHRRELQRRQRQETEAEEDRRVDEILSRLHETGMSGLSAQDRALLQRVSARYRSRQSR